MERSLATDVRDSSDEVYARITCTFVDSRRTVLLTKTREISVDSVVCESASEQGCAMTLYRAKEIIFESEEHRMLKADLLGVDQCLFQHSTMPRCYHEKYVHASVLWMSLRRR